MSAPLVIGAGPAGLAAAWELTARGAAPVVLEADSVVGGLARTCEHRGFRCDIGGHRFFTKVPEVLALWREVLGAQLIRRRRKSRIFYRGAFFDYPLNAPRALCTLGPVETLRVGASLLGRKLRPVRPEASFADWVSNRFGPRLFEMFFRTYTEKVWGIGCDELSADWAAQRIRNLSLGRAVLQAVGLGGRNRTTSLITEFDYPPRGPGQMYEAMARIVAARGATVALHRPVVQLRHADGRVREVVSGLGGETTVCAVSDVFSSMPLNELVAALDPPAPAAVLEAARALRYRSILTVNLLLDAPDAIDDNWVYLHDPSIRAGRAQFYGNWSPQMVPSPNQSIVGLEYFCWPGDELWCMDGSALREVALADLRRVGVIDASKVFDAFVVRYAHAYPVYDEHYRRHLATIRGYLTGIENLYPIGRYGQFRYNNMDHSIQTARYAVAAAAGAPLDPWAVNVEREYHEAESE